MLFLTWLRSCGRRVVAGPPPAPPSGPLAVFLAADRSPLDRVVVESFVAGMELLVSRFEDWIRDRDPAGILRLERYQVARAAGRGVAYKVTELSIRYGTSVRLYVRAGLPGRTRVGDVADTMADGSAILSRVGVPRREFYWLPSRPGQDAWVTVDQAGDCVPLTRECFEEILVDLLG